MSSCSQNNSSTKRLMGFCQKNREELSMLIEEANEAALRIEYDGQMKFNNAFTLLVNKWCLADKEKREEFRRSFDESLDRAQYLQCSSMIINALRIKCKDITALVPSPWRNYRYGLKTASVDNLKKALDNLEEVITIFNGVFSKTEKPQSAELAQVLDPCLKIFQSIVVNLKASLEEKPTPAILGTAREMVSTVSGYCNDFNPKYNGYYSVEIFKSCQEKILLAQNKVKELMEQKQVQAPPPPPPQQPSSSSSSCSSSSATSSFSPEQEQYLIQLRVQKLEFEQQKQKITGELQDVVGSILDANTDLKDFRQERAADKGNVQLQAKIAHAKKSLAELQKKREGFRKEAQEVQSKLDKIDLQIKGLTLRVSSPLTPTLPLSVTQSPSPTIPISPQI